MNSLLSIKSLLLKEMKEANDAASSAQANTTSILLNFFRHSLIFLIK